jgi:hypothetical protein
LVKEYIATISNQSAAGRTAEIFNEIEQASVWLKLVSAPLKEKGGPYGRPS